MESSGRTNFSLIKLEGMMLLVSPECSQCSPALQKSSSPCRLWWCPTGPFTFLPIHAAGIYNMEQQKCECISDYVVSSYTPTLKALITPPSSRLSASNPFKMMAVIQSATKGYPPLPATVDELHKIEM